MWITLIYAGHYRLWALAGLILHSNDSVEWLYTTSSTGYNKTVPRNRRRGLRKGHRMWSAPHADKTRPPGLPQRLTDARLARGFTQTQLAQRLALLSGHEIHPGRISEWETGQKRPSAADLRLLTRILEAELDLT